MINLIRLELKKAKLRWYFNGATIATILIFALIVGIQYVEKIESGSLPFTGLEEALIVIGVSVRSTFIVFAAVLLSKLVIDEYKNKTILLMYSYPIERKKIMMVKLLIASSLTFVTIVISNSIVAAAFLMFNHYVQLIPDSFSVQQFSLHFVRIITFAIAAAGASLVPLYFGMRKQSVPATIVSSLLIIVITGQHNPAFSLANIIYIPATLAVFGILIAYWTVRNVNKVDVL